MNLLAIVGSARKGKATDTLVDKATERARSKDPDCSVKKIHLMDYNIEYCKNCLVCRDTKTDDPYAKCVIRDDMDIISEDLVNADALIMATPVHMGYATAVMTAFLARIVWTFSRPEGRILNLSGLPTIPRSKKKRKAIVIVPSGIIPPLYRRFCDWATSMIKATIKDALNAQKPLETCTPGISNTGGWSSISSKHTNLGKSLFKSGEKECPIHP